MRIPVFFTALFIAMGLAESAAALILVLTPADVLPSRPAAPASPVRVPEPEEFVVAPRAPAHERVSEPVAPEPKVHGCLRCPSEEFLESLLPPSPPASERR